MKTSGSPKAMTRIAVLESDPLRFVGFRSLLESQSDFEILAAPLSEIAPGENVNIALVANRRNQNLFEVVCNLKAVRPGMGILVTGPAHDDETILGILALGAKGYVQDGAPPSEFVQAIRAVNQGSLWFSRRVLALFIDRAFSVRGKNSVAHGTLTDREKQVLKMLVTGLSNREIGGPLGIEERTVKAHVSKIMRKVGVQNRIALSVHAITKSLVGREVSMS